MKQKGSSIADKIIRDYKIEQYYKKKAQEKKNKEKNDPIPSTKPLTSIER